MRQNSATIPRTRSHLGVCRSRLAPSPAQREQFPLVGQVLVLADTFNRASSSSTVNPASDGGSWDLSYGVGTVMGIMNGGSADVVTVGTSADAHASGFAFRDAGQESVDLRVKVVADADPGFSHSYLMVAAGFDSSGHTGVLETVALRLDGGSDVWLGVQSFSGWSPLAASVPHSWLPYGTVFEFRLVYHQGSGNVECYRDGELIASSNYKSGWLGTSVGFGSDTDYASQHERFTDLKCYKAAA